MFRILHRPLFRKIDKIVRMVMHVTIKTNNQEKVIVTSWRDVMLLLKLFTCIKENRAIARSVKFHLKLY